MASVPGVPASCLHTIPTTWPAQSTRGPPLYPCSTLAVAAMYVLSKCGSSCDLAATSFKIGDGRNRVTNCRRLLSETQGNSPFPRGNSDQRQVPVDISSGETLHLG